MGAIAPTALSVSPRTRRRSRSRVGRLLVGAASTIGALALVVAAAFAYANLQAPEPPDLTPQAVVIDPTATPTAVPATAAGALPTPSAPPTPTAAPTPIPTAQPTATLTPDSTPTPTFATPSPTPSPAPITAPVLSGNSEGGTVNLSWTASTGGVAPLRYRVWRDGRPIGQRQSWRTFSDSPAPGIYSYSVRAVDARGVQGPFSNSQDFVVTVSTPPSPSPSPSPTPSETPTATPTSEPSDGPPEG